MNKNEIIDILNNDLKNEWKHLRFYLYHASAVTGPLIEEYKELFLKEASGEMNHVTEFSDLIIGLGGTATDESNEFEKFTDPFDIISYALKMEEEVVSNYVQRMQDASLLGGVDGQWLEIFMENQIQKSRQDVDHYRQMLKSWGCRKQNSCEAN
jgi:bacterioferritin (cytochrome b1)